ncbi:MAG TPA: hypothetical protein EYQ80_06670, partial [Candidatus Poseidoniales archaeon]|nr:hypothetical protein [Candidatus Poseidoniales archaeon]
MQAPPPPGAPASNPVAPAAPAAPAPAPAVSAPAVDLRAQLLAVVADKTGYPAEMLTEDMDLEADLGVDSIKRVEILSALHEAVPGLPDVEARELAALRTLGEIAAKFDTNPAGQQAHAEPVATPP